MSRISNQEFSFDSGTWGQNTRQPSEVDDVESMMTHWEQKMNQLETQLSDFTQIRQNVNTTLQRVRTRPLEKYVTQEVVQLDPIEQQSKEESFQQLQNISLSVPGEQSFNYDYVGSSENDRSIQIQSFQPEEKIQVTLQMWWHQDNIKISTRPIGQFLNDCNSQEFINNFLDVAIYDNTELLQLLKKEQYWDTFLMTKVGIDTAGHRKAIYLQLMEDCGQFQRKGLLMYGKQLGQDDLPTTIEWLRSSNIPQALPYLEQAGYESFINLMTIQSSELSFVDAQHLRIELNIDDAELALKLFNSLQKMVNRMVEFNFQAYMKKLTSNKAPIVTCGIGNGQCNIF